MIDYCGTYLGKSIHELDYDLISNYFLNDPLKESNVIEYKSYNSKGVISHNLKNLKETICSFLNSDGGILIWGAPKGQKIVGQSEKIFRGSLEPVDHLIEKDKLISTISDGIVATPIGINVEILEKDDKFVYVFEIQKSIYSPHQFNNTYFMRIDGQKKPAPHAFIEAMFKKISFPNLSGEIIVKSVMYHGPKRRMYIDYEFSITNNTKYQNEIGVTILMEEDGMRKELDYSHVTLHFGNPFTSKSRLERQELKEVYLIKLWFGGQKSPLKCSECEVYIDKDEVERLRLPKNERGSVERDIKYSSKMISKDVFPD